MRATSLLILHPSVLLTWLLAIGGCAEHQPMDGGPVGPAPVSQVVFTVQPRTVAPGTAITPAPSVALQDALGNTVTSATNVVTIAIGTKPAGGSLGGTTTVAAVGGVATFPDLVLDDVGAGYTLTATSPGLTGATSVPFAVVAFTAVSTAGEHTCGVTSGGTAYCWGPDTPPLGRLGDGRATGSTTPVVVSGGLSFATASAGPGAHSCGVTIGGAAHCWGFNHDGQLGNGTTTGSTTPSAVSGGLTFASVTVGQSQSCGLTTAGAAYCWGYGFYGSLGDGMTTGSPVPVAVSGGLGFATVSTGRLHSCGVTTDGAAYCWGANYNGQLGDSTISVGAVTTPMAVSNGLRFTAVSAGEGHSCGVTTSDEAYCWGGGSHGQLGDGTTVGSTTPVAVAGGLRFASVSAGSVHTCGVTTGGAAYCWGWNSSGQLGNGTQTGGGPEYAKTPVPVVGELTFAAVSAGFDHTCGVTVRGVTYCWGRNDRGQLGDGTTTGRTSPRPVHLP